MSFIEILKAVFLGIVEGITEWLPISSTGHIILVDEFIKLDVSAEFLEMFTVVIQLGAIMAVVVLYFHKLNPFSPRKKRREREETFMLWVKVAVAALPSALIGIPFNDKIDELFYNYKTVAVMLIVYGVLFIVVENINKNRMARIKTLYDIDFKTAALIGVFQVLALIPGTSRSGATILGGILVGCSRFVATEFTFFLAIPTMLGASLIKMLKFGIANLAGPELPLLLVGMAVAFIVSIISIKFLLGYIKKNDFKAFGYYRIILGVLVIAYFWITG